MFSNTEFPYNTVAYINDTINGIFNAGSGVLVSPDEVLTASHMVWSSLGYAANNITVAPGYNGGSTPYGDYSGSWIHYYNISDANGSESLASSQYDVAIIHLSSPVSTGYMGLQSNFSGGYVHITGFPQNYNNDMVDTTTTVSKDPNYSLLDSAVTGHGTSGGPLWISGPNGPHIVGLVSSGDGVHQYNVQITTNIFNQIISWIHEDDFSDPLVESAWYKANNPDVAAAPMTASYHYDNYGWHEGRNPNPFFFTVGYRAANPDVNSAGIDPLSHYENWGWKEGRDTSANFDTKLYLLHNPDVAAAGIDPLQHYIDYGKQEGRPTYEAIGPSSEIAADNGFDPEFYLLENPDVAKAALGTSNPISFAYHHYEEYGWREGRNPNAWFNVDGYLSAYPDVKAAGIDPLFHYDNWGWKEGRDPSSLFDTDSYLAHYGDVKNAGVNPLLHYLEYGAFEGRGTFGLGYFRSV